ncbi:hypothetical protein KUTeg_005850 [Tegillarca granosa]|uniref:Uncharacterized protein n=1 Tax=Tegillarca granosa TaxID=220873 RepID=A0ABQ9FH25_TEGGR|nr:hypothetical protein KUTeg_005850 [Tegillarca granosa]
MVPPPPKKTKTKTKKPDTVAPVTSKLAGSSALAVPSQATSAPDVNDTTAAQSHTPDTGNNQQPDGSLENRLKKWRKGKTVVYKKGRCVPVVPEWEINAIFDPYSALQIKRTVFLLEIQLLFAPIGILNLKGRAYDTDFPNSQSCQQQKSFIVKTILERIGNGLIQVIGKVDECEPLTVKPTKPRLCHDERFLNLWIQDNPFKLDTLKDVPRIIERGTFLTTIDDKIGYDHVLLSDNSKTFFEIQFGGWYMVYNTLPFVSKAVLISTILLDLSLKVTVRTSGVPCLQYIDHRLIGEYTVKRVSESASQGELALALKGLYIVVEILTRPCYTLSLSKCQFDPCQVRRFLGLLVDSYKQAFVLPQDKRAVIAELRDHLFQSNFVEVKSLQRFAGKFPAAKMFTVEVNRCIGLGVKSCRPKGFVPWRDEKHFRISIVTDSSGLKWGAVIELGGKSLEFSDFWDSNDVRPIHVKEAHSLLNALISIKPQVADHRIDAFVDNMALVHTWNNQGRKDPSLNRVVKNCVFLQLMKSWNKVQSHFGPHTCDLMSLDSDAMKDKNGEVLKHFTPFPTTHSVGVNVFSQNLALEENQYVYPSYNLIAPILRFLQSSTLKDCTMIVPVLTPFPAWWRYLWKYVVDWFYLRRKGDKNIILVPSRQGLIPDAKGLRNDLMAAQLMFFKVMRKIRMQLKTREQSRSHVVQNQAKSLFCDKRRSIDVFICSQLCKFDKGVARRFVLYRDLAFLLLQFFAGDLGKILSQEVKRLPDDFGLIFSSNGWEDIK